MPPTTGDGVPALPSEPVPAPTTAPVPALPCETSPNSETCVQPDDGEEISGVPAACNVGAVTAGAVAILFVLLLVVIVIRCRRIALSKQKDANVCRLMVHVPVVRSGRTL